MGNGIKFVTITLIGMILIGVQSAIMAIRPLFSFCNRDLIMTSFGVINMGGCVQVHEVRVHRHNFHCMVFSHVCHETILP